MAASRCNGTHPFFHHLCYLNITMKKIVFSALLLAALAVSAQKTSNKLTFQKGQTLEVTTNMNITTQLPMGEIPVSMVMTDNYAVGETTAESTQLTKTPKRVKFSVNAMGQDMSADSDNPGDLQGQLGEPIKQIMKQKQEFTVDAAGLVTSVKADENSKKDDGGTANMMMPGLNNASVMAVAGQPSVFKILPSREVAKGDSWTDSTNAGGNKGATTYTVKEITDKDVLLDFTGQSTLKTSQSMMGMTADVTGSTKISGTVTLDKATGLLKQKTFTSNTDSVINASGQEMNTTSKITVVMTVKPL